MKDSPVPHLATHEYPLIDLGMSRYDCLQWLKKHGYPEPTQSSCIGCPFHNDSLWLDMKENAPDEFEDACDFDDHYRDRVSTKNPAYLHGSLKPLREVKFTGEGQTHFDFGNDCTGLCGT